MTARDGRWPPLESICRCNKCNYMKIKAKQIMLPLFLAGSAGWVAASSHREAPLITETPKLDGTDFYAFRSYEAGREGFVTLVANFIPLQDGYGGPNYFAMDPEAVYEIHVDNTGDSIEDLTFQFQFTNTNADISLAIGPPGNQKNVAIPLINAGALSATDTAALNRKETFSLKLIRGPRRTGPAADVTNAADGGTVFNKPVDFIGTKSIGDYKAYAAAHVHTVAIPGSATPGRVFVGQRKDPFVVNLGETFDLVNLNPLGPPDGARDSLADKNVTSLILEVPISLVKNGADPVIGCWSTASKRINGALVQQSRLGMALVNEVVIGLKDKDRFNASEPKDDPQFLDYVTHPTLPALLQILFGVQAPTVFPRSDLVAGFLTGVDGLNKNSAVGEMVRLNVDIPPKPAAEQKALGVLAGDLAGWPNGRRPGDDVVDASLRVVMGVLLPAADAPAGQLPYTDGAKLDASFFDSTFPYLKTPIPGSPNSESLTVILQAAASLLGPFQDVPAVFDPVRKVLMAQRIDPAMGYYRARTEGGSLRFTEVSVAPEAGGRVELGVARPN